MTDASCGGRTILIVDADRRFRRMARRVLGGSDLDVREATSGDEALGLAAELDLVLVLLEVRLRDISGYEVCRRLRDEYGEALPIVFVSRDRVESSDRVAGLLVGADDYLVKPIAADELLARVRLQLQRSPASGAAAPRLTLREREILRLLASGLGPVEIAGELAISRKTVATHVEHIYAKLGVHTRAQAVASAFRLALVD
jgi:DNA-binding NarL/FixJ family response regulator